MSGVIQPRKGLYLELYFLTTHVCVGDCHYKGKRPVPGATLAYRRFLVVSGVIMFVSVLGYIPEVHTTFVYTVIHASAVLPSTPNATIRLGGFQQLVTGFLTSCQPHRVAHLRTMWGFQ